MVFGSTSPLFALLLMSSSSDNLNMSSAMRKAVKVRIISDVV